MQKRVLVSLLSISFSLFMLTACAEDSDTSVAETTQTKPAETSLDIMEQAVDFSSPENIEQTFKTIEEKAGKKAAGQLKNAINYLLVYDLSVGRDKAKLYKKLEGNTPNQILQMAIR